MSFKRTSRPRTLNQALTQHSDAGGSSGFQMKTPKVSQRSVGNFGVGYNQHMEIDDVGESPFARQTQASMNDWPYPQHRREPSFTSRQYLMEAATFERQPSGQCQLVDYPVQSSPFYRNPGQYRREPPFPIDQSQASSNVQFPRESPFPSDVPQQARDSTYSFNTNLQYPRGRGQLPRDSPHQKGVSQFQRDLGPTSRGAGSRELQFDQQTTRETPTSRGASSRELQFDQQTRETPTSRELQFGQQTTRETPTSRDGYHLTREVRFEFDTDETRINSKTSSERVFYGRVDQVLNWFGLIKNSGRPSAGCLFSALGVVESMVMKDGSQLVLLRGEERVLQCIYYVIDRTLPQIEPSSTVLVTGNMIGSRKLIMHDMTVLTEEANIERISYLSDRAITRYVSTN